MAKNCRKLSLCMYDDSVEHLTYWQKKSRQLTNQQFEVAEREGRPDRFLPLLMLSVLYQIVSVLECFSELCWWKIARELLKLFLIGYLSLTPSDVEFEEC